MKRRLLFVGPVLTASGYGVHARQLLDAINKSDEFDLTVESLRWGDTPFLQDEGLGWIRDLVARPIHKSPEIVVQVSIPNEFKRRAPLMIGVTAGIEVDRVSPQWIEKCNSEVDIVVVPSEHSRSAFMVEYQAEDGSKLRLEKPLFVVPEGVDTSVFYDDGMMLPSSILDELKVPQKNFIFVGLGLDKPHGKDRKNIGKLVEWFSRAFAGNENVGLILKAAIVNGSMIDFEVFKKRVKEIKASTGCGEFPKIFVVHGRLEERQMAAMYNDARVIAAVSLTHGEGFGLPLIEAAACGLPVVATDWSGHLDFLTKSGKKLFVPIEYDLAEIPQEVVWPGVIEPGTRWANPREADVVSKLQKMVLSSTTPRNWASDLRANIHKKYSLEATGLNFMALVIRAAAELDHVPATSATAPSRESFIKSARERILAKGPSLLYTMPMSAGDVFLSTGVVSALRKKHPGHRVYFATSPQYFDIVKNLPVPIIDEVIEWQPWMQDITITEEIFDAVYTPNLAVQMNSSNWIHRGAGRNLIDEFAVQCDVVAEKPFAPVTLATRKMEIGPISVAVHAGGQKSARAYAYWEGIVKNLRANNVQVIQVGAHDDIAIGEVDIDLRGKTDHLGLVGQLRQVHAFVGIDSYPMHVANVVGTNVVAIFGSSYATSTGPKNFELASVNDLAITISKDDVRRVSSRLKLIETEDRNGCSRACYKDVCKVDVANPCSNNIPPQKIFDAIADSLGVKWEYREYRPKIAGYTHILNPNRHGYPYVESISSMLGFCDEVIVVDGGSDASDGVQDDLQTAFSEEIKDGRLKVIIREWDADEPGMDGMQKAFGRAMVAPDTDFIWQQDADEIVHEGDYQKIIDMCKRFPKDVDLLHLPVVELWGDQKTVRTDRHSWKWRLSRNNLRITHGINSGARLMDPKTGRIYAKEGMSDGCEMIDIVTGDHLPHRGFYTGELDKLRKDNPAAYGTMMNDIFAKLPAVWHYSWANLPRKVKNFRDFWDKQWQVLYQSPAKPRFPDVVTDDDVLTKADELRKRGGEHESAPTFEITKTAPALMKGWV